MKVLVTGSKGQLGHDVIFEARSRKIDAIGVDINEMDITNAALVKEVIANGKYDAVIHCAAWTAVDAAENEQEKCREVNVFGTENIAVVCRELDIPLMYFSTDYVFGGDGEKEWGEYDEKNPLNVYGQTKYEGELAVGKLNKYFIIRISWVFGLSGNNFVKTMLEIGRRDGKVCVVNDQFGSPTYTPDLSVLIIDMIQTNKYGVYHATNEGTCSWFEFAKEIFNQNKMNVEVIGVNSSEFPVKAIRPKNSRLAKQMLDKNGFSQLPSWQNALRRYIVELED